MRHVLLPCVTAALLILMSACNDSSLPADAAMGSGPPATDPASLCVRNACGSKLKLLAIGDAENIQFSDSGRLFVSGGSNVFEITRSGSVFAARPLLDGSCNFTGLAIRANTLYANCFNGMLYAAPLAATAAGQALLQPIYALGITAANGLVEGPDASLYVVNGPITGTPLVLRLTLDASNPLRVTGQSQWLGSAQGLVAPNGIQRRGQFNYVMNSNPFTGEGTQLLEVPINADGSAGTVKKIAGLTNIGDDFALVGDHFLMPDYGTGGVTLLGPDGGTRQSIAPGTFSSPSHIAVTQGPLFKPGQLLVTEKGVIGEGSSTTGNALTLFYPSSDSAPLP